MGSEPPPASEPVKGGLHGDDCGPDCSSWNAWDCRVWAVDCSVVPCVWYSVASACRALTRFGARATARLRSLTAWVGLFDCSASASCSHATGFLGCAFTLSCSAFRLVSTVLPPPLLENRSPSDRPPPE